MNTRRIGKLSEYFDSLQQQYRVADCSDELARTVTFEENAKQPVHRWFRFKEAFSPGVLALPGLDTRRLTTKGGVFVDPFCGSGTTLVAGDITQNWMGWRIGVEVNPYIAFVAQTKASWRQFDPGTLQTDVNKLLAQPFKESIPTEDWPKLSTLTDTSMVEPRRVSALLDAALRVRELKTPNESLLLLGIAASLEGLTKYRKTGRALYKIRRTKELRRRHRLSTEKELGKTWSRYQRDLESLTERRKKRSGHFDIVRADSRSLSTVEDVGLKAGDASLMVYSPPYLNHIDYTEVYKVEAWLLGFIRSDEQMRHQRALTIQSHASLAFIPRAPKLSPKATDALDLVTDLVAEAGDTWHRKFPDTARTYFADMGKSFEDQYRLLASGAQAVCVVGNTAHGAKGRRVPIAVDLFLADLARRVGFEVTALEIARYLPKKDFLRPYLRETIIWLRRPSREV